MLFFGFACGNNTAQKLLVSPWAIHANMVFVSVVYRLESGFNYEPPMVSGGISSTTSGIGNLGRVEKRHQLLWPEMLLMWIPGAPKQRGKVLRLSNFRPIGDHGDLYK